MKMTDIFPGLNVKEAAKEIYEMFKIKGVQGAAELSQALFTGGGYVPYGRGQTSPKDHDHEQPKEEAQPEKENAQEREGR
jgi:hypothetical protein